MNGAGTYKYHPIEQENDLPKLHGFWVENLHFRCNLATPRFVGPLSFISEMMKFCIGYMDAWAINFICMASNPYLTAWRTLRFFPMGFCLNGWNQCFFDPGSKIDGNMGLLYISPKIGLWACGLLSCTRRWLQKHGNDGRGNNPMIPHVWVIVLTANSWVAKIHAHIYNVGSPIIVADWIVVLGVG